MIVRWRLGRMVEEPPDCSDSDSPESSVSDSEESRLSASVETRVGIGEVLDGNAPDCRICRCECSSESVLDGGRSSTGDGVGELVALRRAAISRNAATEIRCEESTEPTLPPRGRGMAGGMSRLLESGESFDGDSGPMCRKDLRLKDSAPTSTLREGGSSATFDFLRSLCAHEKSPPPPFFGAGGSSVLVRPPTFSSLCRFSRSVGRDLVDVALLGSPYAVKRVVRSGGRMESRSASERELGE